MSAETTFDPGANRSTHVPLFDAECTASMTVEYPTVMAPATLAGETEHASMPSLPAETVTVTPAFMTLATA